MATLAQILEETLQGYAGQGFNGYSYFMKNDAENVMSIMAHYEVQGEQFVDASIMARVLGDNISIDYDITNKPLVDALLQAGVPREQIILAYAGEKVTAKA